MSSRTPQPPDRQLFEQLPIQDTLSPRNVDDACKVLGIYPSRHLWFNFFDKALLIIGSVCITLSLVFFIAYNWLYMGKIGKFALVEVALAISVISYAILAYFNKLELIQKLLLVIASIVTGSLLALVGQVYQTGADTWQLFFNWALLIIPFVLVARFPALWLIWLGLINITFYLFMGTNHPLVDFWLDTEAQTLVFLALLNRVVLYVWLYYNENSSTTKTQNHPAYEISKHDNKRQDVGYHWSTYVVGIFTAILATMLGLFNVVEKEGIAVNILTFGLWILIMVFYYWRFFIKKTDLLMLTCFCVSLVTVVMALSVKYIDTDFNAGSILFYTLLLMGMSASAITWLLKIHRQHSTASILSNNTFKNSSIYGDSFDGNTSNTREASPESNQSIQQPKSVSRLGSESELESSSNRQPVYQQLEKHNDDTTPWFIQLFLAGSGLLSGILTFGFIVLLLDISLDNNIANVIVGCVLMVISATIFYKNVDSTHEFLDSLAFSLSLAGQVFIIITLFDFIDSSPTSVVMLAALQLILIVLIPNFLHRLVNSLIMLGCIVWLLSYIDAPELAAGFLALSASVFGLRLTSVAPYPIARANKLASSAPQSATSRIYYALYLASSLMLLAISVFFIMSERRSYITGIYREFSYSYHLAQGVLIAVSLYAAYLILNRYAVKLFSKTGGIVIGAVLLLGISSLYVSGLLATCLVIAIAYANQTRAMLALGITALVCYIFWYYYQLDTSLLLKSLSMFAVGMMVLLIRWVLVHKAFNSSNMGQQEISL